MCAAVRAVLTAIADTGNSSKEGYIVGISFGQEKYLWWKKFQLL